MKTVGIIAFAFGVPNTISSNQRISQIASRKAREMNALVYTQLDVLIEHGIEVEYINEQPGNPPSTLQIARAAIQWAQQRKLNKLWIVAAKPHLWRALRDVKKAVREAKGTIEVYVCSEDIEQYSEDSWFCPDSTQRRVQSKKAWRKREMILRLLPFFLYYRIFSKHNV